MEPSRLQSIYHTIVCVSLVTYSEGKVRIGHELILIYDLNFVRFEWSLHIQEWRVVEKDWRSTTRYRSVIQYYSTVWWFFEIDFFLGHIISYFGCLNIQNEIFQIFILLFFRLSYVLFRLTIRIQSLTIIIAFITFVYLRKNICLSSILILRLIFGSFVSVNTSTH